MKRIIICALIAFCFAASTARSSIPVNDEPLPYIFEDVINKTIQDLIANLTDPIIVENWSVDLPDDGIITGSAGISNLELAGLKSIEIRALKFDLLGLKLEMTAALPKATFKTEYNLDAMIHISDGSRIFGSGSVDVDLTELVINIDVNINLGEPIQLRNLLIDIGLESLKVDITGLMENEELSAALSQFLTDNIANFFNQNHETLSRILGPLVEDIINYILSQSKTV